jgi:hypothetical protein
MITSARRRLTLFDLLVLIAATGVGFTLLRPSMKGIRARPVAQYPGALAASYITTIQTYASCFLTAWSPAIVVLSLRQPRVAFRRVSRSPGFMASAAATAGVVLYSALCLIQYGLGKLSLDPVSFSRMTAALVGSYSPLIVAGAWLALWLGSRWRAEKTWIGWAGRLLGVSWIGLFLIGWLRVFV